MLSQILWHSPHLLPMVIALGAILVAAVVWLYPSHVTRVNRPWRWILPGLRILALLALAISLLQPTAQRLRRAEEQPAVLVLFDRSRSMSVTDPARPPAKLVAFADSLGRLPAGARAGGAAGLARDVERLKDRVATVVSAGHDLETAEAFGRGVEAARAGLDRSRVEYAEAARQLSTRADALPDAAELMARLKALTDSPEFPSLDAWAADALARSQAASTAARQFQDRRDAALYASSPAVKAACDELATRSRWSLVEDALLRPEVGLVPRLSKEMPVLVYAFSESAVPVELTTAGETASRLAGSPDGVASDAGAAVSTAIAHAAGRPVRAVVLFGDGRQASRNPSATTTPSPAGMPVYTVDVAPVGRPRDVAIGRNVSVPDRAFVGETLTVRGYISASGMPSGPAEVQLRAGSVFQKQSVELKADGVAVPIEFTFQFEQGGPQSVTLGVTPSPGEITTENNVVERWVRVSPAKVRVAAFAATAGWDFQFLERTLGRTGWIDLRAQLLNPLKQKLPMTPEDILQQDVILLSDVPADALDDVQWDAVNRLVRERGGTLFLQAGPDFLPATFTPSTIVPSALLPFDVRSFAPSWRTWPGEQAAFRFVPPSTLNPRAAEALRLGEGAGALSQWQSLSGAFRFMAVPELNARIETRALLIEGDSRLPVLTESRPGNGRVYFLGTNETWRWRKAYAGRDFDRFWLQMIRYAVGPAYTARKDLLTLDVDKIALEPGESLNVQARVLGDSSRAKMQVMEGGRALKEPELSEPADSPARGVMTATVAGLKPGNYAVRLTDSGDDNPSSPTLEIPLHVAAGTEFEMADVAGDAGLLTRLAETSGGEPVPLDRLDELPKLLAATAESRSPFFEVAIWDSPLLFLFVVACFAAEWSLRKRLGLA